MLNTSYRGPWAPYYPSHEVFFSSPCEVKAPRLKTMFFEPILWVKDTIVKLISHLALVLKDKHTILFNVGPS